MSGQNRCYWRWRFQPVFGYWGHLGVDYCFESPTGDHADFLLRHVDYGLPGDDDCAGYRQSIGLHAAMISRNGAEWPPLRTPFGRVYETTDFRAAPRAVGEFLLAELPRFWGPCGAYRMWGPNSNTGLRHALMLCERATGYAFGAPPWALRMRVWGWDWPLTLTPHHGPCAGYVDEGPGGRGG